MCRDGEQRAIWVCEGEPCGWQPRIGERIWGVVFVFPASPPLGARSSLFIRTAESAKSSLTQSIKSPPPLFLCKKKKASSFWKRAAAFLAASPALQSYLRCGTASGAKGKVMPRSQVRLKAALGLGNLRVCSDPLRRCRVPFLPTSKR